MNYVQTPIKFDIYKNGALLRSEICAEPKIRIGRLPSSQLRVDDESVSRMHALIEASGPDAVTLLDLGSPSGTVVNGAPVTRHALRSGDRVQLGDVQLVVTIAGQGGAQRRAAVRAAPLFDDEDDRPGAPRALEVLVQWGETVINVRHYTQAGAFTLGEHPEADQFVPNLSLPMERYPLATYDGEVMIINPPEGVAGEIMHDDEVHSLEVLRGTSALSGGALRLPPKARCRLNLGELTIFINSVVAAPAVRRASPFSLVERQQVFFLSLAALLHGLYFAIVLSMPAGMQRLSVDGMTMPDRFSEFFLMAEEILQEKPVDLDTLDDLEEDAAPAAKAAGIEGDMGDINATDHDKRFAVKGPADNKAIRLKAQKQAMDTAQAAFESLEGEMSSIWSKDERAIGSDAAVAFGGLFGDEVGASHAFGGRGIKGMGDGGGGPGESSIGISNTGIFPTGGRDPHGKRRRHQESRVGERKLKQPQIIPKDPIIKGSIDKEEVRRVIRRHRNEYRYCYERELNVKRDLAGKIVVKFVISGQGGVIASSISESTMRNTNVERCLTKKIKRWAFPKPKGGGIVTVRYPFIFKSS